MGQTELGAAAAAFPNLEELPGDATQRIHRTPAAARWTLWACTATDPISDALKILFLSTTFAILTIYAQGFTFNGDSHEFTDWAVAMARGGGIPPQPIYASRDIGYPLLLWISGYPYTHSLLGIAVLQAVMAALMPLAIYLAIRPLSASAGYYAAVASVLSFVPFVNMKQIHHDQAYGFFLVVSATLWIAYVVSRRPAYLYWGTASFLFTGVTSPMGNLLFLTFLMGAFVVVRGPVVRYAACLGVGVILLLGYIVYRHVLFGIPLGHEMPSYMGEQAIYDPYVNAGEYAIGLSPDIGPAMRQVIERTDRAVPQDPQQLRSAMAEMYKGHESFPEKYYYSLTAPQLRSQLFAHPNVEYFYFLLGAVDDDRLDLAASLEIARRYPGYIAGYSLRNIGMLLAAPGWKHSRFNDNGFQYEGNPFPLAVHGYDGPPLLNGISANAPAARELRSYDFTALPYPVRIVDRLLQSKYYWPVVSRWAVTGTFAFILAGAFSLGLRFLLAALRISRLSGISAAIDRVLPAPVDVAFAGAAVMLLEVYVITGMYVDPAMRYYHQLEGLRFVVAGFGAGIVLNMLREMLPRTAFGKGVTGRFSSMVPRPSERAKTWLAATLAVYAITGFASWIMYAVHHAM